MTLTLITLIQTLTLSGGRCDCIGLVRVALGFRVSLSLIALGLKFRVSAMFRVGFMLWRSQDFAKGRRGTLRGSGEVPQRGPGAEPWWGSVGEAPEARDNSTENSLKYNTQQNLNFSTSDGGECTYACHWVHG